MTSPTAQLYPSLEDLRLELRNKPRCWALSGCAGFIGSHLLSFLLSADQKVRGLDNFATGKGENLKLVEEEVGALAFKNFSFIEGDICQLGACEALLKDAEIVLHQAALGSVPRSIENPLATNATNVGGFLSVLQSIRKFGIKRLVYASSSSVYGAKPILPRQEDQALEPLSPYAVSKLVNEQYAKVFAELFKIEILGLRYFNVFGPRQDPNGAYAAVIPRWIAALLKEEDCQLFGDGSTSRDFCYVENVVQANIRAALAENPASYTQVYNIALGGQLSLLDLFVALKAGLAQLLNKKLKSELIKNAFRSGDVLHSRAEISKAETLLGYQPKVSVTEGIARTLRSYL